jgi:hypothetical protein
VYSNHGYSKMSRLCEEDDIPYLDDLV